MVLVTVLASLLLFDSNFSGWNGFRKKQKLAIKTIIDDNVWHNH